METIAAQNFFSRVWNAFISAFRYYAAYSGRSSRFDFWSFTITNGLINILLSLLSSFYRPVGLIYFIYSLVSFSPSAAVGIRRYHDNDLRAWIFLAVNLAMVISIIAALNYHPIFFLAAALLIIINLFIMLRKGNPEANRFGLPETTPVRAFETPGTIVLILYILLNLALFTAGFIRGYTGA